MAESTSLNSRLNHALVERSGRIVGADSTYIELLLARLEAIGDAPVLRYQGRDTTAAELRRSVFRYARALTEIGIARGSVVALFAPNSPDAIAIRYGTNLVGAAATYLSIPVSSQHRMKLIAQINPDLLVLFRETVQLVTDHVTVRIAVVGTYFARSSLRLDEMAAAQPSHPVPSVGRPDDLAIIVSSGGTTGVPKGSMRHFAGYTAMVNSSSPPNRRQLINGRLAYLSQILVDTTLLSGGFIVLEHSYDATNTLATIESERITDLFLVEPQLFELMDHPEVDRRDLSSLRTITHIGASAPLTLRRRARERFGPVLVHVYGASEVGVVSVLSPTEYDPARPEIFASAGRVRAGVEIRFRRVDGTLASPGNVGSIEVRSPAMADGYRNLENVQAANFREGWFRTGDLGFLDPNGYLHILGRAADIIWMDGVMLSPTLVEDALCRVAGVRYAVVVMDHKGGLWVAAVIPWPGSSIDQAECREAIAAEYGASTAGSFVIVSLDRIPLTEQGKPNRVAIQRLARAASLWGS
jgi:acyl-CoA synthetase (AMP-forming)/AMP-acid ligase II